ncbi:MAG: DNA topoisomerase IA [Chloroflexi bacterium AL-W]|nr:DNA topoisomerase IA [Chloroflexi bacterium AL-W]
MTETTQAYCMKCREKRDMIESEAVFTAGGAPGTRGKCAVCGTTLFRMGETPAHAGMEKPEVVRKPKPKKAAPKKKQASSGKAKSGSKATSKSKRGETKRGGKLVIVESPAKARTVGNFLGKGYTVRASKGHVRDLLVTQLSVDVENEFEPKYRVPNDKRDTVKEIKAEAERAEEIYLATDPDREGEAIAWHLMHAADIEPERVKRVIFHEITDSAVEEAFQHPRELDMDLINAQQARRILDRLVGYNITELLWDRVRNRLSAGRVQSIAVRMVVDRENEIEAFIPEEYWTIHAKLRKQQDDVSPFVAKLVKINGEDFKFSQESDVLPHLEVLKDSIYQVDSVKRGTRQRRPSAPFTTSTLQQEASRRFGFNARRTMRTAQQLYEGIEIGGEGTVGLITYMRTDSTSVSEQAQQETRDYVTQRFDKDHIPAKPPIYKTKAKGAQEAHEAIRPTRVIREPSKLKDYLNRDQMKLYTLIWERFVASQMASAIYNTLRIEIRAGRTSADSPYLFRVSGSTILFRGFMAIYEETRDEDEQPDEDEGRILPDIIESELLALLKLLPEQHFTQPPPRYTEASLVRTLEEYGIGRPSTYAPTVAVIQDRDYVEKLDKRLVPTETGKVVNDLLVQFFPNIMNYQFTASMEDELDDISEGKVAWRPMLQEFYTPFEQQLKHARSNMPKTEQVEYIGRNCPTCADGDLIVKYGRWGKFIGCSNYPDCKHTEPYLELTGIACPTCGDTHNGEIVVRKTKRGRTFYGCSRYPDCDYSAWKLPGKTGTSENADEDEDEAVYQDEAI